MGLCANLSSFFLLQCILPANACRPFCCHVPKVVGQGGVSIRRRWLRHWWARHVTRASDSGREGGSGPVPAAHHELPEVQGGPAVGRGWEIRDGSNGRSLVGGVRVRLLGRAAPDSWCLLSTSVCSVGAHECGADVLLEVAERSQTAFLLHSIRACGQVMRLDAMC